MGGGRAPIPRLGGFLTLVLGGWLVEGLLVSSLPLLILSHGGNATSVGLVALCYAMPSILSRPVVGRVIDRRGASGVQTAGGLILALAPIAYLWPHLVATMAARFFHGIGWSLYGTANNVSLAVIAPADRRGEVSGYFSAARAIALLIGPIVGLWLYTQGAWLAMVAATSMGAVATVTSYAWGRQGAAPAPPESRLAGSGDGRARLLEPSAVPSMLMVSTFSASQLLFLFFAPVYAETRGYGVEALAWFYPLFGLVLAIAPLVLGGVSDRLGRTRTISAGCGAVIAGLGVAALPTAGMWLFILGSLVVAGASSMVTSAIAAMTIDRAPTDRIGSAMATYSMGYQLAAGLGGLLWGALITLFGFPWPFFAAMALQVVTIAVGMSSGRRWRRDGRGRPS